MRHTPALSRIAPILVAALVSLSSRVAPAAPAEIDPAAGGGAAPLWAEAPALLPLSAEGVVLEKAIVQVEARAGGPIRVTTTYTLANAKEKAAQVKVALPTSYTSPIEYLDATASVQGAAGPAALAVTLGSAPAVELSPATFEAVELPADGPLGAPARGLAFTFEIDSYAATELTVRQDVAWAPVAPARMFPTEKGFSVGFVGLDAWGAGREAVSVAVTGEPALLGPATWASPRPYRYDSKGVQWTLDPGEDGTLAVPQRFTVVTLADWNARTFAGTYYARYEVPPDDDYRWDHRFFHAQPVSGSVAKPVLRLATLTELIRALDEMEQVILARNGKPFDDTFAQMRFQKEPWYRPNPAFSEDTIKQVERWNLDYARCSARAARTAQSALEKMKTEEVDATGRSFKMLLEAFRRCDEQFWNPRAASTERPLLQ